MRMLFYLMLALTLTNCSKTEEPTPVIPSVSIEGISVDEGNSDRVVYIRLQLSAASSSPVTAYIKSYDGSAKANEDYLPIEETPVVFAPGVLVNEFKVNLLGDEDPEQDEDFYIRIENVDGGKIGTTQASIFLLNDDAGGLSMIWHDEFDGDILDPNFWNFEIGTGSNGWGNNESQYYRTDNTLVINGNLIIEARKENYMGSQYTSSRLTTKNKFEFKYGRVDIRAKLPFGQGIWPALWMLGSNISSAGWPACGETDIMELIGHQPGTVYGTAHWSDAGGQHAQFGSNTSLSSGIFNDDFHIFSIIWDDKKIEWLLDDQPYNTLDITPDGLSEFHQDFFFIFNVAVGGNWPGYPNASTTFPQQMVVDYIRVFQGF